MKDEPCSIRATEDQLRVVYILMAILHWSYRRVSRLMHHHHTTISNWYSESESKFNCGELSIEPEDRGAGKAIPVGDSRKLEQLDGLVNHRNNMRTHCPKNDDDTDGDDGEHEEKQNIDGGNTDDDYGRDC
ncbi:MAG: hypothetical protein PHR77_03270 [Kiritimatiellae bacterium]|nr:hypothetical protein [Kiritimatiellia bacterium]MDD5519578.1 hypothetical protein [Kiritimatiellia bacterium]